MSSTADSESLDAEENASKAVTIKIIIWVLSVASTLLIPIVMNTQASGMQTIATVAFAAASWTCLLLLHLGFKKYMPELMISSILVMGCFAVLASGSVRSAVTIMFVGGVAAAGVFLTRTALLVSGLFAVSALGMLTWAEIQGHIQDHMSPINIRVWIIESTGIVIVGFMVYFSRVRARRASDHQILELNKRLALEAERDRLLNRFTRIFRNSPSPMLVQSAVTLHIVDVNPALERCFGYGRESILGANDLHLWADSESRKRFHQLMAQDRRVDQFKTRGKRRDGTAFDVLVSSEWGTEQDDQLIITTVTDVSHHNRAMEHLRKSEERFAKAFNFIPLTLLIARMSDGLILEAHAARNGLEEIDIEAVRGKTSIEVGIWKDEAARKTFVAALLRDGHINAMDTTMRGRYGNLFEARIWGERIELDDEDCILTCIVNVSEEKRREVQLRELAVAMTGPTSEQLLRDLTRHISTALGADKVIIGSVREADVQTMAVWGSGAIEPNFSYPLRGSPCAQTIVTQELCEYPSHADQVFPDDALLSAEKIQAYLGQSLHDQDSRHKGILTVMWRRPIEVTADMRALISICASRATAELQRSRHEDEIHDLNAHLEERVSQRTSELQRLNTELDSFAYSVSHDLKSPLRAIDGYAHILRGELDAAVVPNQVLLLDRVLAATHRMSNLIADLLALARVSQATLSLSPVHFSELVESVAAQHKALHPDREVDLRIESNLSCVCDAKLTRIVLENLLGNAFKYSKHQLTPLIEVGQVANSSQESGLFYVRDNGAGFDMAHADKLFKPFQRLHKPSEFEGSGIGLATVHRIVERHGGEISACSSVGIGTTVYFTLGPNARPATTT